MKYSHALLRRFICFILLFVVFTACGVKKQTITPTEESITYSVYASGIIKSKNQYQVFSKANGIITDILVHEGDLVKKGQAIIRLSDAAQKLNYENAKLNAAYLSYSSNKEKIQQAQTELEVATLKMENELSLLERQKKLWSQEIGTKNEIDQRELSYKNAVSAYKASKLRKDDLQKQLDFQSKQTERNAAISAISVNDYTIKSEQSGKIYSILKEIGEMATTQTPIAIIGDASNYYIELQIDEYDISKVKPGQAVLLTMDSYKEQVFEAVIEKVYPLMNEKSKSFKVDAIFTKIPLHLFPNLSAEANIIIEKKSKALTIPRNYIIGDSVVTLSNNEKRKVITGLKDYEKIEIISGITTKDQLIKPVQ